MTSSPPLGLRERKRRDVRARIEAAALLLVLRDGLEATTVDAISERADVSPRTFFNHFDTKDSAILGVPRADGDRRPEAEVLLALCVGAARVAVQEWAAADTPTSVQDIERRAVALIGRIGELT